VAQINNNVPIYGADAIAPVLQRLKGKYRKLEREVVNVFGSDLSFGAEMLWHYTRIDGSSVTIPAAHFVDRNHEGLMISVRVYADTSPAFD